jgi:hypothetical protein
MVAIGGIRLQHPATRRARTDPVGLSGIASCPSSAFHEFSHDKDSDRGEDNDCDDDVHLESVGQGSPSLEGACHARLA